VKLVGWLALLVAVAAFCGACGSSRDVTVDSKIAIPPPTLSPRAVPYLPSSFSMLTPAKLAREAGAPALRGKLGAWGFLDGADRYFQGQSRQLQVVDSRLLRFRGADGADRFIAFVRAHVAVYLGSYPGMREFSSRGRNGILATAQACSCHLANPAFLAVVAHGGNVTWLEINGPGATAARLEQLIAAAP
jgi:hypothetical protein